MKNRVIHHFNIRSQLNRPSTSHGKIKMVQHNQSQSNYSVQQDSVQSNQSKYQWKEKENLVDENIQLKIKTNQLKEENKSLKMNKFQLERELFRFEKLVEDHSKHQQSIQGDQVVFKSSQLERSGLVMKLKQKQKTIVLELINKTKEIDELKKNYRTTKIQELEIELQNAMEETVRLRSELDKIQQILDLQQPHFNGVSLEERYILLEKTLQSLQRDNQDIQKTSKGIELVNKQLKIQLIELDKIQYTSSQEVFRLQKVINTQNIKYQQLANQQSMHSEESPPRKVQQFQQKNIQRLTYEEDKIGTKTQESYNHKDTMKTKEDILQSQKMLVSQPSSSPKQEKVDIYILDINQYYQVLEDENNTASQFNSQSHQNGQTKKIMLHKFKIPYNILRKHLGLQEEISIKDIQLLLQSEPFVMKMRKMSKDLGMIDISKLQ